MLLAQRELLFGACTCADRRIEQEGRQMHGRMRHAAGAYVRACSSSETMRL